MSFEIQKLEQLCIDYVVDNLDRLCAAYVSAKSKEKRFRYDLLQRIYTETLIDASRYKMLLRDEHVPFLINRHVKSLDMRDFSSCSWKKVEKRLLKYGNVLNQFTMMMHFCDCNRPNPRKRPSANLNYGFETLSYQMHPRRKKPVETENYFDTWLKVIFLKPDSSGTKQPPYTKECCEKNTVSTRSLNSVVSRLKLIKNLNLSTASVTDETLKVIGKCCPHLHSLDLDNCKLVTDKGLEYLFCKSSKGVTASCSLRQLKVTNTSVSDFGIAFMLKNMKSIEVLSHEKTTAVLYNMHKKDIERNCLHKVEKYNLVALDIEIQYIENNVLAAFSELCPRVRQLNFPFPKSTTANVFSDMVTNQCFQFNHLESVSLNGVEGILIDCLLEQRGGQLVHLDLNECEISLKSIAKMCPKLKLLSLSCVRFSLPDNLDLPPLKHLKKFRLFFADFKDDSTRKNIAAFLSESCLDLEVLRLEWCTSFCTEIEDSVFKCSKGLIELNLSYSKFEPVFLRTLILNSPKLKLLDIRSYDSTYSNWIDDIFKMLKSEKRSVFIIWEKDNFINYFSHWNK